MQDISSIYFSGVIEASDVVIAGARDVVRRASFFVSSKLSAPFARMSNVPFEVYSRASLRRQQVAITYGGGTGEFLMMTTERLMIPAGNYTVGQLLCNLYRRGDRWVDALDDNRLMCTVNGREATLFDPIVPGAAICISSQESVLESRAEKSHFWSALRKDQATL
ncbi:MAG: hypothetical protein WA632_10700 [Gallionella sp.]